jgi:catechol 2,3-dioxygenase-like lactoylglutathione lyase family enzyme
VNDLAKCHEFYTGILGLKVDDEGMGMRLHLPDGGVVFVYSRQDHQPASFTILNFVVKNIDEAVDELNARGVSFERYQGIPQDEKGILRGLSQNMGQDIAWFRDPAGNILSVLQDS